MPDRSVARAGVPILGIIFLALAFFKFVNGGSWAVWAILGCLFGGLSVFSSSRSSGDKS